MKYNIRGNKIDVTKAINDYIPLVNLDYICAVKNTENKIIGFSIIEYCFRQCNFVYKIAGRLIAAPTVWFD